MTGPQPRAGLLCVGAMIADLGKVIDAYPTLDGLATIEEVSLSTGGSALNVAIDVRLLGAAFPVEVVGAVGDDLHGRYLLDECARHDIDARRVRCLSGATTSFTDAMVERVGGRRTFFHHPGANDLLDTADLDLEGCRARILHAGPPGLHGVMDQPAPDGGNGWSSLLARAGALGISTNLELVSLPPERQVALVAPCLPHLDSIIVNEIEAGALTGISARLPAADGKVDWPAMEGMAAGLLARGVSQLAVVHFPAGSVAAGADGRMWRQGSVRVPADSVRSTTGAGDAFAAGVLLGLHDGRAIPDCLRLGSAAAAACVRSPATSIGIPDAAECLAQADRHGYRAAG